MSSIEPDYKNKDYWSSLEELSGDKDFIASVKDEFPEYSQEAMDDVTRRGFLKVVASGMILAGSMSLTSCRRPEEDILAYHDAENIIPGKSLYYASSTPSTLGSAGIMVKSYTGRPIKIEGLPNHPYNQGKTNSYMQADLLDLYDPERLDCVVFKDKDNKPIFPNKPKYNVPFFDGVQKLSRMQKLENDHKRDAYLDTCSKTFKKGKKQILELIKQLKESKGKGFGILLECVTSPSLQRMLDVLKRSYPEISYYTYDSLDSPRQVEVFNEVLGDSNQVEYNLAKADVILSLDNDFLFTGSNALKHARDFADRKRAASEFKVSANRLYMLEGKFSLTGSNADNRIRVQSSQIQHAIYFIAQELLKKRLDKLVPYKDVINNFKVSLDDKLKQDLSLIVDDLLKAKGKALVMASSHLKKEVQSLALLLNYALGSFASESVVVRKSKLARYSTLSSLVDDLKSKKIDNLIVLEGNAAYSSPYAKELQELLPKLNSSYMLSLYYNETSKLCKVVFPSAHYLESWSDTYSYDGTYNFVQPLIKPLYHGLEINSFIANLSLVNYSSYKILKETYTNVLGGNSWRKDLHNGFIENSASKIENVALNQDVLNKLLACKEQTHKEIELQLSLDYSILDGRYSNNGWLQELPDPISKLTWDNALLISNSFANKHKLKQGELVNVSSNSSSLEVPVFIIPGMSDKVVGLTLGYGRDQVGVVGINTGFNAYQLLKDDEFNVECKITKAKGFYALATTQKHGSMHGRDFIKEASYDYFEDHKDFAKHIVQTSNDSLIPARTEITESPIQWGMTIDLNTCTGCGVCTIACQAENNISVVGKERVLEGREMHWIRMDRYYTTASNSFDSVSDIEAEDQVEIVHQPIACMHCESAPCESVCPVAATTHSAEGLNEMTYNRCIGTRYCSNNCPFKVRRFNFFNYQDKYKNPNNQVEKMVYNPNVTMRFRGVMEKCTYCVQRINEAKIDKKVNSKDKLVDFTTACAQACPSHSIVFGDLKDKTSKVAKETEKSQSYQLLTEQIKVSRTSFLAKLRNPNEKITNISNRNKKRKEIKANKGH